MSRQLSVHRATAGREDIYFFIFLPELVDTSDLGFGATKSGGLKEALFFSPKVVDTTIGQLCIWTTACLATAYREDNQESQRMLDTNDFSCRMTVGLGNRYEVKQKGNKV